RASTSRPRCSAPRTWRNGWPSTAAAAGAAWRAGGTWPPGPEGSPGWRRPRLAAGGTLARGHGVPPGLALAPAGGGNAYLDPTALTEDDERALAAWLADPQVPKALHDAKGPINALAARGLAF